MRSLTKNSIFAMTLTGTIFFVNFSFAQNEILYENLYDVYNFHYVDFWSKFSDTVMPDEPQNNNPPKEMEQYKTPKKSKTPKITRQNKSNMISIRNYS